MIIHPQITSLFPIRKRQYDYFRVNNKFIVIMIKKLNHERICDYLPADNEFTRNYEN